MSPQELKDIWQQILSHIQLKVSKPHFITWFQRTCVLDINEQGVVTIGAPNGFQQTWLTSKFYPDIFKAAKTVYAPTSKIIVKVEAALNNPSDPRIIDIARLNTNDKSSKSPSKNIPTVKTSSLNPRYTLDNFIVGEDNRLAFAASKAVSDAPGQNYNPLVIYGGVGLGKTHLLQGIGNAISKKFPKKRVVYSTSENFTNELVEAIKTRKAKRFQEKYRMVNVLIIDDIQFIANKTQTQVEFFHTFNTLYNDGRQIILSSDRPPREIKLLEERLKSRFESGMLADIQPPDFETKTAILRAKTQERGQLLPTDLLRYIAENSGDNIRELEGILTQIIAKVELQNQIPTINVVKEIIDKSYNNGAHPQERVKRNINHDDVINFAAEHFDLSPQDIIGAVRKKEVVVPRQICMYLVRKELNYSFERIGEIFGKRNHSTVIHAYNKISSEVKKDKNIVRYVNALKRELAL